MKLPSFSVLRAFDAAVRLRNFSRAAEELNITQGAMSRHISVLEASFGIRLFVRESHGMSPTRGAFVLHKAVRESIDHIHNVAATLRAEHSGDFTAVRISVAHSFALHWLIPRLPEIYRQHPDLEVTLVPEPGNAGLTPTKVDFSIRYGVDGWVGVRSEPFALEERWPVGAPALARMSLPAAMAEVGLLHDVHPDDWTHYLSETNVERPEGIREQLLNDYTLCLESAAAGLGIALARSSEIDREIRSGRLVSLSDQRSRSQRGYFLMHPAASNLSPAADLVWKWILDSADDLVPARKCSA